MCALSISRTNNITHRAHRLLCVPSAAAALPWLWPMLTRASVMAGCRGRNPRWRRRRHRPHRGGRRHPTPMTTTPRPPPPPPVPLSWQNSCARGGMHPAYTASTRRGGRGSGFGTGLTARARRKGCRLPPGLPTSPSHCRPREGRPAVESRVAAGPKPPSGWPPTCLQTPPPRARRGRRRRRGLARPSSNQRCRRMCGWGGWWPRQPWRRRWRGWMWASWRGGW